MVKIAVKKFGSIDSNELEAIIQVMNNCFKCLEPHSVEIVDLYVFEKASTMHAFLDEEKRRLGIRTASVEESFFATHDAWQGIPRIMVCIEKMSTQTNLAKLGGIYHEVGHSVLHGSIEYYFVPIPKALQWISKRFDFPTSLTNDLLYLISIAEKDYEVTRLLCERRLVEDQITYVKQFLKPEKNELASWELAKTNPMATLLFLASILKNVGCAIPLIFDQKHGRDIKESIAQSIQYLPKNVSNRFLSLAFKEFPSLGINTFENIELLAKAFSEKLATPILSKE